MKTQLSVIVPVRNDAEYIIPFYYELIKHTPHDFELIWVNDCSEDTTLQEIESITRKDKRTKCIILTKQFGREAAVLAGLNYANGEYVVIMKGDLQHPPQIISEMIQQLESGYDIVNTVIGNKLKVTLWEKWLMDIYYTSVSKLSAENKISDISQFRAFRQAVINDMLFIREKEFLPENHFNWSDYKMTLIEYKNRKTSRKNIRYTREHLIFILQIGIKHSIPGVLKALLVLGGTLCIASLFFIILFIVEFLKGSYVHTEAIGLTSLLFAGGLQIFVYSSYKKRLKDELLRLCKGHRYVVKNMVEPEAFISEYSYAGSTKSE
jgi:glycosyltransferase involved in cell wall biosynthesis